LPGIPLAQKLAAEQARKPLEQLCKNQPDSAAFATLLSLANSALGERTQP